MDEYCDECGYRGVEECKTIKNTKIYICPECFFEKAEYIANKPCKHEYNDRNGNKCTLCGEPSIHYNL